MGSTVRSVAKPRSTGRDNVLTDHDNLAISWLVTTTDDPLGRKRDVCAMATGLEAVGVDIDALSREVGLPRSIGEMPMAELPRDALAQIWLLAIERSGDPTLPLGAGAAVPFGAYEVIDFMCTACDDLEAGLRQLARYFDLIQPTLRWSVEPPMLHLAFQAGTETRPLARALGLQYALGVTLRRFRDATNGELEIVDVALPMSRPLDTSRHDAFFNCPIRYGATKASVKLTPASFSLPLRGTQPALRQVLERHANDLMERRKNATDPFADLRAAVRERLCEGTPKLESLAPALAMSPRTLQRRLRDEGTTFQAIVDEERCEAAMAYLDAPRLGVGEVAYLLGYSETSAFVRAFKRWTGKTPNQHRAARG